MKPGTALREDIPMRIHTLATGGGVVVGLLLVLAACNSNLPTPGGTPPPGSFRLEGTVLDADLALSGVEVSVVEGTGQGLVTQTSSAGAFTLDGLQGQAQLRFRKQGYS